jgi:hypothetical protein
MPLKDGGDDGSLPQVGTCAFFLSSLCSESAYEACAKFFKYFARFLVNR